MALPDLLLILARQFAEIGVPGSFAAAWAYEYNGRDPAKGGLLGLLTGGLLGYLGVVFVILEPFRGGSGPFRVRVEGRRRRWYNWFLP